MPLDVFEGLDVKNGCPDFGRNHIVIDSIPYPIERFTTSTSDYVEIVLKGDSREFVGSLYYLTPPPEMAQKLLKASSVNFGGELLEVSRG